MKKRQNKGAVEVADEVETVGAVGGETVGDGELPAWAELWADEELVAEAIALQDLYPAFDPANAPEDPVLGPYLRGEEMPSLRQLYEAAHIDEIVAERVESTMADTVRAAVEEALQGARVEAEAQASEAAERLAAAVQEGEERVLAHIRARGHRPIENGMRGESGVRLHPAVERLTRRDRAILASRAERGETIRL